MEYEQGKSIKLFATFVDSTGGEATITGIPTITIYIYKGPTKVIKVNAQNMTTVTGSQYYYTYSIPAAASKTTYNVLYSAVYSDGNTVLGGEVFYVIPRKHYSTHGGSFNISAQGKGIWARKEKDDLIKSIDKINKSISILDSNNKSLSSAVLDNYDNTVKAILTDLEQKTNDITTTIVEEQLNINKSLNSITKDTTKVNTNLNNVKAGLHSLTDLDKTITTNLTRLKDNLTIELSKLVQDNKTIELSNIDTLSKELSKLDDIVKVIKLFDQLNNNLISVNSNIVTTNIKTTKTLTTNSETLKTDMTNTLNDKTDKLIDSIEFIVNLLSKMVDTDTLRTVLEQKLNKDD